MNTLALISLVLAIASGIKAALSFLGFVIYSLDQERQSRDIVLRRQKRFKWPLYLLLAIFFSVLTVSQIKVPSVQINQTQPLEIPSRHE